MFPPATPNLTATVPPSVQLWTFLELLLHKHMNNIKILQCIVPCIHCPLTLVLVLAVENHTNKHLAAAKRGAVP